MTYHQAIPAAGADVYECALLKLRRDLKYLVAVTGTVINAAAPRKAPQPQRQRLLYRRADTLSDNEVKRIVAEIGPERVLHALDRITQPQLPLVAAE